MTRQWFNGYEHLALLILVVGLSAQAQIFEGELFLKVCFEHPTYCPEGQADLKATERVLSAPFGIRHEGSGQPTMDSTAVRFDDPFIVTNRSGVEYRVWVRQAKPGGQRETRRAVGRFLATSVEINGAQSSFRFGPLTLRADGRYSFKSGNGHYSVRDEVVGFDGAITHWGPAKFTPGDKGPASQLLRAECVRRSFPHAPALTASEPQEQGHHSEQQRAALGRAAAALSLGVPTAATSSCGTGI